MVSIKKIICISYARAADGRAFITAEIIADTVSELPDSNTFDSYILSQGSVTQVMETGKFYIMDSSGNWCEKSESYTKEELDILLAQKVSAVPGRGLISDAERQKLSSLENYDDTEVKEQTALNRSTLGYQRKNLLKNRCGSRTSSGVTAAVNANGTITLNGTSEKAFVLYASVSDGINNPGDTPLKKVFPDGEYYLSGGISGKAYMQFFSFDETRTGKLQYGGKVTVNGDYPYNCVRITVDGGKTFDNEIIYPMLRCADITDDTYEPYKSSVEERLAALEAAIMGGA